ncbi:hypothetical protein Gasu2_13250 [Galdieria sulphuraria]|uniref:Uncharacterized protein n=1 Tax=Galdieria sulphuraria TaxID=130081 RepID=M2XZJ7_GALSU|nr:uncharacterized protein Gasu_35700 [Galdieria sulphuraria]EME28999.1 hypothetical protein Gasu_35700 [Galdieria sulphuraria]GJD06937.1 hypothetical protein Gasu2_13250 [Galdieria sulphuraria]|eukprot:XP_005705519.1 hypothetical protein Gasu_35700 [Galdieria sulphuraria]
MMIPGALIFGNLKIDESPVSSSLSLSLSLSLSMQDELLEQWKLLEKNTTQLSITTKKIKESLGNICDKVLAAESKIEQLTTPLHTSAREILAENHFKEQNNKAYK